MSVLTTGPLQENSSALCPGPRAILGTIYHPKRKKPVLGALFPQWATQLTRPQPRFFQMGVVGRCTSANYQSTVVPQKNTGRGQDKPRTARLQPPLPGQPSYRKEALGLTRRRQRPPPSSVTQSLVALSSPYRRVTSPPTD